MAILWCGGEDLDFPNGSSVGVTTTPGTFRAGFARCSLACASGSFARSNAFSAVTSCWLTAQWGGNTALASLMHLGLVKDPTTNAGLWLGTGTTVSKLTLYTYDGTTKVVLASETGTSEGAGMRKLDMQVISYGASGTVNIYQNGVLLITFTGNIAVSGVTSLSAVGLAGASGNITSSEIIVSDSDTRSLSLQTLALTGAGTTNNWTNNTFSNVNLTTFTDANPTSSNTNAQVQDYNVTDAVGTNFVVLAVKISARAAKSATPTVNQIKLGYNNGSGTSGSGTGATKALGAAYTTYEQYDTTNPMTSTSWAIIDITPLQLELTAVT